MIRAVESVGVEGRNAVIFYQDAQQIQQSRENIKQDDVDYQENGQKYLETLTVQEGIDIVNAVCGSRRNVDFRNCPVRFLVPYSSQIDDQTSE